MPLGEESLKQVVIKTSHNSFAEGSQQVGGKSSARAIASALDNGARAIEIDVWYDAPTKKLVVAHGSKNEGILGAVSGILGSKNNNTYFTNQLDLQEALRAIKDNAFKKTQLPLILFVDIGWNREDKEPFKLFGQALRQTLGNSILSCNDFSFDKPLKQFSNKILLMPSISVAEVNEFDDCCSWGCYRDPVKNYSRPEYDGQKENLREDSIVRVYPQNVLGSGNYDPTPLLADGVTFVALDFATEDRGPINKLNDIFKGEGILPIREARQRAR